MRSKKQPTVTCKLTEKNRIYLEMLGYLDARTGKASKKSDISTINHFINRIITYVLEQGQIKSELLSAHELKISYLNYHRKRKQKERDKISDELKNIAKQLKEMKP